MKFIILFLLIPVMTFSQTGKKVKSISASKKQVIATTNSISIKEIGIADVQYKNIYSVTEEKKQVGVSFLLAAKNGKKIQEQLVEKFGMPDAEISDNFCWKVSQVFVGIYEKGDEYILTFRKEMPDQAYNPAKFDKAEVTPSFAQTFLFKNIMTHEVMASIR